MGTICHTAWNGKKTEIDKCWLQTNEMQYGILASPKRWWGVPCFQRAFSGYNWAPLQQPQVVCQGGGGWVVPVQKWWGKNKEAKLQNQFWDKEGEHLEQYQKVKAVWTHFAMDKMLLQLFHLFRSQKNKSLNFHQTRLTPKDQRFFFDYGTIWL